MLGTGTKSADRWFRVVKTEPKPCVRLLCFPHAGGTASFFRTWKPFVPTGIELMAICYPGREERIAEPFAQTMEELVRPLALACRDLLDVPIAFFGHSMGVWVAYEVAIRLQRECGVNVAALFLSGGAVPGRSESPRLSRSSDDELVKSVLELGGMDAQVLENNELRSFMLNAVRADYGIIEQYKERQRRVVVPAVLDAPVIVYYGKDDDGIDAASVNAWSKLTSYSSDSRCFDGGHFYLVDHTQTLLNDLFGRLGYALG